ncbi:heavy metal translocating P-type ATPase [Hyphobacterium sp. HN65]|uniref:Heavy metal translocating P-type ATPase n=1 Tax=Hyphobacterium lacteum TaxID=3116575 RepID=A0ABU7LRI6_9PROT|nr:heavy metal translocating P-type ATPase [Hyphobacterium sp. HN65]MEE2526526.1 heavy metal translocating P-type ATPase [Hyphobacterium sp. HN65]
MAAIDAGFVDPEAFVRERDGHQEMDLLVSGVHCAGCISRVETAMQAFKGVRKARLNLSTGRLALEWDGPASQAHAMVRKLSEIGYPATPFEPETGADPTSLEEKRLVRAMAVAGFATANTMLFSVSVWSGADMGDITRDLFHWLSALIVLPTVAYSGRPFFTSAWKALSHRQVNMDVPISLAVLLACGLSLYEMFAGNGHTYFDAAAMLLFFLLIGRWLDSRLRAKAGAAARRLAAMQAATANRVDEQGHVKAVPAREIRPGDTLLIAAGEKVAVDAEVVSGSSQLDAALVTGETRPLEAQKGTEIFSGMVNLGAPLTVKATARKDDSLLAEITRLVEAGEQSRSRYVKLADIAARLYVPIVHSLAALTVIGWLMLGAEIDQAIINAIAVLIITCPCALALAVPAVQVVASGRLYRSGILVKSGDALERLAEADAAAFDKTGTLTMGKPQLVNRSEISEADVQLAAMLARTSRHPLSRAIADPAGMGRAAENVTEVAGGGLEAVIDGETVRLGSAGWLGIDAAGDAASEVWLKKGDAVPVRFAFTDVAREGAGDAVREVEALGLPAQILSGDHQGAVAGMAAQLGMDHFRAGLKPAEKIAALTAAKEDGRRVLMVGDGINDAPALASAHVSMSLASASDISQAAADFVIQRDRLSAIPEAIIIARKAKRRVLENFGLAVIYNMIAVPLAVFGFVTPLVAAIAMSASSLLVTLNALRLSR